MPESSSCPECGAVLPAGAEQCSLCGTAAPGHEATGEPAGEEPSAEESPAAQDTANNQDPAKIFCNECGWQNPAGANFCSRCGHRLQSLAEGDAGSTNGASNASPPPGTRPADGPPAAPATPASSAPASPTLGDDDRGLGTRVAAVVGVAALVVAGLYGWSAWSGESAGQQDGASGPRLSASGGGAPPVVGSTGSRSNAGPDATRSGEVPAVIQEQQQGSIPAAVAAQADSLQQVIETRNGRRKRLARRELGSLFAGAGLTPRAAAQQWQLAQEAGDDPAAWERAGSLLYDWMASLSREDRAERQTRAQVARLAVDAYERVLEGDPDNYDVRTNLAVAYLDTNNPMRGISEIKRVLQEEPDHVGARFNYGLMQVMIGRNASALQQFGRVRQTASEDSPYYQQAGQIIERIESQTDGAPQNAPMPGQGGNAAPSASRAPTAGS